MEKQLKLSEYAKLMGVTYKTAHNWWKLGKIDNAYMSKSGSVFVRQIDEPKQDSRVVVYCRVSNQSRKDQVQYQIDRCVNYCISNGYEVSAIYKEIASGMNDKRKELWRMLKSEPTIIVIENKDRLTRFGFEYLEQLLLKQGCRIVVLNPADNDEQDLIKDLVSVVTSFCCRLYGLRRTKNKLAKIKSVIHEVSTE